MKAMVLKELAGLSRIREPLKLEEVPVPEPGKKELLLKVLTCGVCHTELDEIEGRTPPPVLPVILGHQVVGRIANQGKGCSKFREGERVGVAWIYSSCGKCEHCLAGNENLCKDFRASGRDADGGYAEYMVVHEDFVHPIPEVFTDAEAAPLLCAGAIGYRSLRLTGIPSVLVHETGDRLSEEKRVRHIGLTGFGASAHLVLKMIRYLHPAWKIYVFARNPKEREFALELGAAWAGGTEELSPELLDTIIDTTPVWKPVLEAMKNLRPGGRLVINAIRKENIDREYLLNLSYEEHLWMEKEIKSVANVALNDVRGFLELAAAIPIKPEHQVYPLEEANLALMELKQQKIRGAKVLIISG